MLLRQDDVEILRLTDVGAVLPHLFLKREPLRSRAATADVSAAAAVH
jgi:hypothetical protein